MNEESVKNQRICGELVHRHVICNVSNLIGHFARNCDSLDGSDYDWEDDLRPLLESVDYEEAARYAGWVPADELNYDQQLSAKDDGIEDYNFYLPGEYPALQSYSDAEDWEDLCRIEGIEPDPDEIYEHWVVDDFLYEKLEQQGESVGELFNLRIWGRGCTGQVIKLDSVIQQIAADMEILAGQANEWKWVHDDS